MLACLFVVTVYFSARIMLTQNLHLARSQVEALVGKNLLLGGWKKAVKVRRFVGVPYFPR